MRQVDRNRDVRVMRRLLWALVLFFGAVCALLAGFAALSKTF